MDIKKTGRVNGRYIEDWCKRIIKGSGGFISLEEHEMPIFEKGRDIAIVEFVIRALANIECDGSAEILTTILERRNSLLYAISDVSNSLLDLDGKTIPVTFHVSKFEPKIDIDLSNDY
jgi:hypothetical protein